jgi:DNA ligase-associated metallophosphoesterase
MMTDHTITLRGQRLRLLPERAAYWEERRTLLVADAHWGKAAAFRAAAIPVPGETTTDDLQRLTGALLRTGAERIVFLGDLLHAKRGRSAEAFAAVADWRAQYAHIEMLLVRGNHDTHAGDPPENWRFACRDAPVVELPFAFVHEPAPVPGTYALAGHLHPGAPLVGAGGQRLRLPCFWFAPEVGTLPAFGSFPGVAPIAARPGDRVFVVADDEVLPVGSSDKA